ncbi:MAG: hypothetical protein GY795_24660 [Desulfobacterales bacterium]|nr:hypothetical protein [Desulfobacterales bacterium]
MESVEFLLTELGRLAKANEVELHFRRRWGEEFRWAVTADGGVPALGTGRDVETAMKDAYRTTVGRLFLHGPDGV